MASRWFTAAERPGLSEAMADWASGWPAFVFHDDVADRLWHRLERDLPGHQHYLCDGDELVAAAASIPVRWDGTLEDLPAGWDGALEAGFAGLDADVAPTALCALAGQVAPGRTGEGLSARIIGRFRTAATAHGFAAVVAPVRPTDKHRYPLIPMEVYVGARRPDGAHVDPWLRTHERAGGRILGVAHQSMVVTGTVAEWERWTDLPLPCSGEHVVSGALAPVLIDLDADRGRYEEPNVWVHHTTATR